MRYNKRAAEPPGCAQGRAWSGRGMRMRILGALCGPPWQDGMAMADGLALADGMAGTGQARQKGACACSRACSGSCSAVVVWSVWHWSGQSRPYPRARSEPTNQGGARRCEWRRQSNHHASAAHKQQWQQSQSQAGVLSAAREMRPAHNRTAQPHDSVQSDCDPKDAANKSPASAPMDITTRAVCRRRHWQRRSSGKQHSAW